MFPRNPTAARLPPPATIPNNPAISDEPCGASTRKPGCAKCSTGKATEQIRPNAIPGHVTESGMIRCSKSIRLTATHSVARYQATSSTTMLSESTGGRSIHAAPNRSATESSTSG